MHEQPQAIYLTALSFRVTAFLVKVVPSVDDTFLQDDLLELQLASPASISFSGHLLLNPCLHISFLYRASSFLSQSVL